MAIVPFSPGRSDVHDDDVMDQAIEWQLCLAEGSTTDEACRAWRDAHPAHEAAWREVTGVWENVARSESDIGEDWRAELDEIRLDGRSMTRRRVGLAIAASVAVFAAFGFYSARPDARYATQIGETSQIALEDGSSVTLGGKSAIALHLAGSERRVVLDSGEAFFEVARDADRPFVVEANGSLIRVTGTKFDVRSNEAGTTVSVLEGKVEVGDQPAWFFGPDPLEKRVLTAGLSSTRRAGDERFDIPRESGVAAGGWRSGRFYYQDATLAEIVSDLSRYSVSPISIGDNAAGRLRVTTSFEVGGIPEFLDTLAQSLPVEPRRTADGGTIIESRRAVQ